MSHEVTLGLTLSARIWTKRSVTGLVVSRLFPVRTCRCRGSPSLWACLRPNRYSYGTFFSYDSFLLLLLWLGLTSASLKEHPPRYCRYSIHSTMHLRKAWLRHGGLAIATQLLFSHGNGTRVTSPLSVIASTLPGAPLSQTTVGQVAAAPPVRWRPADDSLALDQQAAFICGTSSGNITRAYFCS